MIESDRVTDSTHWAAILTCQPTWQGVIKIFLAASLGDVSPKKYQMEFFARAGGDTAMLDLMPLLSPDATTWNYSRLYPTRARYLFATRTTSYRMDQGKDS